MAVPEGYVSLGLVGFTDKGDYDASAIYMQNDLVHKDNAIWKCKVDNTTGITPDENDNWTIFVQSQTSLSGISAVDTYGATGETGEIVVAQELIDAIANRVMNQLVEKAHIINNGLTTEEGYALDARQANPNIENTLAYLLAQLNSNFSIGRIRPSVRYVSSDDVDCDTITEYFRLAKGTHFPGNGFFYVMSIAYENNPDGTIKVGKQIAHQYQGHATYERYSNTSGIWSDWEKLTTNSELMSISVPNTTFSTADDLRTYYDNLGNSLTSYTKYRRSVTHSTPSYDIGGGNWYLEGFKTDSLYEYQVVCSYDATKGIRRYARSKYNGTWSSWVEK